MLQSTLEHKMSSSLVDFFSCDSLAHYIKRSPDLRFFMLFGSPAMLIMVLCTSNGEREEIVSPSFSEWIIKNLGT